MDDETQTLSEDVLTLLLALSSLPSLAVIVLYGVPDSRFASPSRCSLPLQLHFGSDDAIAGFSDPKTVDSLETQLKEGSCPYELHRYAACGHAFANATHFEPMERAATRQVKGRAQKFFTEKLK